MWPKIGKIVDKFNAQNVLWYLEKELVVTGQQCWLTKISQSETTLIPSCMVIWDWYIRRPW